jgi:imidazolonepropionase-like amidohydrolase
MHRIRRPALALLLLLPIAGCATTSNDPPPDAAVYRGFTLLDPERERRIENAYVVVAGGRFVEVGQGPLPARLRNAPTHDLPDLYAMPGFIDAHAHITAGPHRIEVRDGAAAVTMESRDEVTAFAARMALGFGVTTVRNPGGDPEANARYDAMIAAGGLGPDALHAGAVIQPPPFVGNAFRYPRSEAEWDAEAARQAALGMRYFKLYQSLTEEELATGIRAAHAHELRAIAHLNTVSWARAIELGMDGLEHALPTSADLLEPDQREAYLAELGRDSTFMYRWFERVDYDGPLMQDLIAAIAREDIDINLTLVVNEITYNIDSLDVAYPVAWRAYAHPDTVASALTMLPASAAGWTAADFDRARAAMPRVLEFARRLYLAGAEMMIGTDGAGGTPFYARELELHAEAGIPNWAILRMATSDAADIMGIGDRTGRVRQGNEADMVFLRADPAADVSAAGEVHAVMTNGRFHLASALLTADPR